MIESPEKENDYLEHLRFSSSYHRSSFQSDTSHHRNILQKGSFSSLDERKFAGGSNYNHNKRYSRTRQQQQEERAQHHQKQQSSSLSSTYRPTSSSEVSDNVIALYGAYGVTGQYFLQLALEAGYQVRVLLPPGVDLEMPASSLLKVYIGSMDEESKVKRTLGNAKFVVCMLNDCSYILQEGDKCIQNSNTLHFVQSLVRVIENSSKKNRVLLYQATSVAIDQDGSTPMLASFVKKMTVAKVNKELIKEQDDIVHHICTQLSPSSEHDYIVTRPSNLLWDRPSRAKLAASKSQPGPCPITYVDLAEFSLNALKTDKLYNSCPYVVQDY